MRRKQTTVYKVVSIRDGKYYSWCINTPGLVCGYKLGETTRPLVKGTRLFAFKGVLYAWPHEGPDHAVLLCSAVVTGAPTLHHRRGTVVIDAELYNLDRQKFRLWWQWQRKGGEKPKFMDDPTIHTWHCSSNSVLCSEITPLSVVTQ